MLMREIRARFRKLLQPDEEKTAVTTPVEPYQEVYDKRSVEEIAEIDRVMPLSGQKPQITKSSHGATEIPSKNKVRQVHRRPNAASARRD
jgi:hypothetical protein